MDENELSCTKHLNFEVLHITAINEPGGMEESQIRWRFRP